MNEKMSFMFCLLGPSFELDFFFLLGVVDGTFKKGAIDQPSGGAWRSNGAQVTRQ